MQPIIHQRFVSPLSQTIPTTHTTTQWRHYRGGEGAAALPDSHFVIYGTPVHQVVNMCIICKIMQIYYIGNSLLGDKQLHSN